MVSKISVLMPVYNGELHVRETIDSILNQTFEDFEFIIVNDGSTDNTKKILKSYKDDRIKLFHLPNNVGVGRASQYALERAEAPYIARVDADDLYDKRRLEKQYQFLLEHQDVTLVKTFISYFADKDVEGTQRFNTIKGVLEERKNSVVSSEEISNELYRSICIPHTSIMARTNILKQYGYREMKCGEDYDLFYRMNLDGLKMGTIKEYLVKVRVSSVSTTTRELDELYKATYYIKEDIIKRLFKSGQVYLWGAGSFGKRIQTILSSHGHYIHGFIDSDKNKIGKKINGKQVYSAKVLETDCKKKIIVTSQPGAQSIKNTLQGLEKEHLQDYIVYL